VTQLKCDESKIARSNSVPSKASVWMAKILYAEKFPSPKRHRRKLVSIIYADVSNYSGLTEEDEEGTHACLVKYIDLMSENIRACNGKIAHFAGDAVLAMFSDVVDVVKCAVSVQNKIREFNLAYPTERRLEFRIGINLGEAILDRGDIYGNAVNVATRLESLADPGGIVVSDAVRISIGNRLPYSYVSLGEQWVKNINAPVRAYSIDLRQNGSVVEGGSNVTYLTLNRH